jgi:SNF family Na+-dependent transporter
MTSGNHDESGKREEWSSRMAFYFTAIGAAVGFGNVWRFPALSVQYGGGAFFVPYLLALFLIGLPILILEAGFGTYPSQMLCLRMCRSVSLSF